MSAPVQTSIATSTEPSADFHEHLPHVVDTTGLQEDAVAHLETRVDFLTVFVFDLLNLVPSLCVSAKSVNGGSLSSQLALSTEKVELEAET